MKHPHRASICKNWLRKAASLLKTPRDAVVVVLALVCSTPRMAMHMCVASIMTCSVHESAWLASASAGHVAQY